MKKILNLLLILLLSLSICSCNVKSVNNTYNIIDNIEEATSSDYINILRNYHVRDKNEENTIDNEEFEDFLDSYFLSSFEDNYITAYNSFYDYSSYGIEKPEVTWGVVDEPNDKYINEDIETLNILHSFDYDKLSYNQQFDYDTLEYSMYEDLSQLTADFDRVLLFDSSSDSLQNIIDTLNDFEFRTKEYLDDYMILLADTDRYIDDLIKYFLDNENEYNYYLIDYSIDYIERYIDKFLEAKENPLIKSFKYRLDNVDFIDKKDKANYLEQNNTIVNEEIIPSINKVRKVVESHRGKVDDFSVNSPRALSDEYAESLFTVGLSYNKSIDEMYVNAVNIYKEMLSYTESCEKDEIVQADLKRIRNGEVYPIGQDYDAIIEFLEENYTKNLPNLGYIDYDISSIDSNSANSSVLAYFRKSPIDKPGLNIIKYNPNSIDSSEIYDPYFTVAHESIPGHMYDYYRFFLNDEHPIMRILYYGGVTEGYAKYSEMLASEYLDIDPKTQKYLAYIEVMYLIRDGIYDLSINYYNSSDKELSLLLNALKRDLLKANEFRDFYIDSYGVYSKYGIGLANILTLKNDTKDALGDLFDEKEFNDLLTKHGRIPLVVIEDEVNKYVAKKLNNN